MRRRWWLVMLTVLLLSIGAALTLSVVSTRPSRLINRASFGRIKEGMTREEVLGILHLPPGDYTVFRERIFPTLDPPPPPRLFGRDDADLASLFRQWEEWGSDEGLILLEFLDDKVAAREYHASQDIPRRDFLDVLGR